MPSVLIIEDDAMLASMYDFALKHAGYTTVLIRDGAEAVLRIDALKPNLILLDMNLPSVSGVEIYRLIRRKRELDHIPIIICTANNQMADAVRGELRKEDIILLKPASATQLVEIAQRYKVSF